MPTLLIYLNQAVALLESVLTVMMMEDICWKPPSKNHCSVLTNQSADIVNLVISPIQVSLAKPLRLQGFTFNPLRRLTNVLTSHWGLQIGESYADLKRNCVEGKMFGSSRFELAKNIEERDEAIIVKTIPLGITHLKTQVEFIGKLFLFS